ncbi:hypothetical protein [Mycobacterium sp.]|uniref:hypothetical protein n=1 Tax=Mycobacterium sp. TaxID=1785 RepID=UPI002D64B1A4|nr:hypothetical protein [Mycobacterium sp.]HZA09128.1 hypothetical protein [Mycobacterium sp.]
MTGRQRTRATSPTTNAVRLALAGVAVSLGALALAGHANADPEVPAYPTPVPGNPGATPPAPGQPVVEAAGAPVAPAPPPPAGAPPVPEIPNPGYGQGSRPGPLGFLRDAWHQAHDPYGFTSTPPGEMPLATVPPGAGPAPPLPPGYISTNAPGSETAALPTGPPQGAPALPPGYYSKSGPPPPGYFDPPPDPAAPPTIVPHPPTP